MQNCANGDNKEEKGDDEAGRGRERVFSGGLFHIALSIWNI
jgi:hypothetical protein